MRFGVLFPITVCVIVAGTFCRLFFGVDFTDESHYLAMTVKFLRGQSPFADEVSLHQTSALLVTPFFRPYFARYGVDGIVLYGRMLFFFLNLLTAAAVFLTLRRRGEPRAALVAALAALAFLPLHIPALSYNSLGSSFLTLGLLSLVAGLPSGAGFCFAVSAVAYPSFVLPSVLAILLWLWWARPPVVGVLLRLGIGALPIAACVWLWISRGGSRFNETIVYALTVFDYGGGVRKVGTVVWHTFFANPSWLLIAVAALGAIIIVGGRWSRPAARPFWLLLPLSIFLSFADLHYASTWFFLYFSLCAPIFLWLLPPAERRSELFWVVWIPSVLAGGVAAWSSSSSAASAVVGLLPAMAVTTFFWSDYAGVRFPVRALPALILVFGQYYGMAVYRDGETRELKARVPSGAFAGLYTTERKRNFLARVQFDLSRWENRKGRVLFYEFPAGYLLSEMKSGGRTSWMRTVSHNKSFYVDYHRASLGPDDYVFTLRRIESGIWLEILYPAADEFLSYLTATHVPVLETAEYAIWKPKATANSLAGGRRAP